MRLSTVVTLACLPLFLLLQAPSFAQSSTPADPVEVQCYRLAASPADPGLPQGISGVDFGKVEAETAIAVCEKAWQRAVGKIEVNAHLAFTLGRAYHTAKQDKKAIEYYRKSADAGFALAMNNLGSMYEWGEGIDKDLGKAFDYYLKATELGFAFAEQYVARFYRDGTGLPADAKLALEHFQRAQAAGIATVQPEIADLLYQGGLNLEPNPSAAAVIWRQLASNGDTLAALKLVRAIEAEKVNAADATEFDRLYALAASGDDFEVIRLYAAYLSEKATDEQSIRAALQASYRALDIADERPVGHIGSFPIHRRWIGKNIVDLVKKGVVPARNEAELATLSADYGSEATNKFTVPMTCNGVEGKQQVYVWDWSRDESPMESQAAYYEAAGCKFPPDVLESFNELYSIARENKVSYAELTFRALGGVDKMDVSGDVKNSNEVNFSDLSEKNNVILYCEKLDNKFSIKLIFEFNELETYYLDEYSDGYFDEKGFLGASVFCSRKECLNFSKLLSTESSTPISFPFLSFGKNSKKFQIDWTFGEGGRNLNEKADTIYVEAMKEHDYISIHAFDEDISFFEVEEKMKVGGVQFPLINSKEKIDALQASCQ